MARMLLALFMAQRYLFKLKRSRSSYAWWRRVEGLILTILVVPRLAVVALWIFEDAACELLQQGIDVCGGFIIAIVLLTQIAPL